MSEAALAALDGRVTNLERALNESLVRIEALIRQEIHDLKTEQIKDIKEDVARVEADLKEQVKRIADDQRRLWDATRELEKRENQRYGGDRKLGWLGNLIAIALSGGIGGLLTAWFTSGRPHP
jgi:hypothetical protein